MPTSGLVPQVCLSPKQFLQNLGLCGVEDLGHNISLSLIALKFIKPFYIRGLCGSSFNCGVRGVIMSLVFYVTRGGRVPKDRPLEGLQPEAVTHQSGESLPKRGSRPGHSLWQRLESRRHQLAGVWPPRLLAWVLQGRLWRTSAWAATMAQTGFSTEMS